MRNEEEVRSKLKELEKNLENKNQLDMIEQIAQIEILEWVLGR